MSSAGFAPVLPRGQLGTCRRGQPLAATRRPPHPFCPVGYPGRLVQSPNCRDQNLHRIRIHPLFYLLCIYYFQPPYVVILKEDSSRANLPLALRPTQEPGGSKNRKSSLSPS